MSRIRGRDTKPEVWLRKQLFARGYRYRKNVSNVPGHPDIWLAKYGTAVFVHGCFWHRHEGCAFATKPATNTPFWSSKFSENIKRDKRNFDALRDLGWRIAIVWECSVRKEGAGTIAEKLVNWLESRPRTVEFPSKSRISGSSG